MLHVDNILVLRNRSIVNCKKHGFCDKPYRSPYFLEKISSIYNSLFVIEYKFLGRKRLQCVVKIVLM